MGFAFVTAIKASFYLTELALNVHLIMFLTARLVLDVPFTVGLDLLPRLTVDVFLSLQHAILMKYCKMEFASRFVVKMAQFS